ncbi:fasciclin domain-containing protein [Hymenobacter sp. BT730]|uniref:fasciclin domain-containing protein n=1 Tax=Hymenobacter sp. BT730 TaxID=3063332 RepID=UPI0026DF993C|nr:fasciclin domain-containing protein [Hymenobacter sp. BT730]
MKNTLRTTSMALFAAALSLGLASCGDQKSAETTETNINATPTVDSAALMTDSARMGKPNGVVVGGAKMTPDKDIVDNAVNSKEHTTLVAAVKAAGLVETLKGSGPFTVFAPTNAAFNELPNGAMAGLMKPESKAKLAGVLTYHVIAGRIMAADLKDGQQLTTVNGEKIKISVKDGQVMINNAAITIPDVVSSNGITHVINQVLLPPAAN